MNRSPVYNAAASRYEISFDGAIVYADVRLVGDVLYIDYVFAPAELRGTGAAGKFMAALMDVVRAENLKAVPVCGYAAAWLQRHPEYEELLAS